MSFVSYAQNFEDVMLWRALKHIQNGVYVDVGAQHPVVDSVSKAFYEHGWRGIHIEPVPYYAQLLRQDRPDEIVLEIALSDIEGTLELNVIAETGLSTAVDAHAQRHHIERGFASHRIQVPVLTLKSALRSLEGKDVHWLKIDVEGLEEKVLKGWDSQTLRPWVMVAEATIPLSNETNFAGWDPILTAANYQFVYFDGLNRFYVAKEHIELAGAFSCPPNVFDNVSLSASSGLCKELISLHQEKENELAAQAQQLKDQLNVVYQSTSWHVTKPLRAVKRLLDGDYSPIGQVMQVINVQANRIFRPPLVALIKDFFDFGKIKDQLCTIYHNISWYVTQSLPTVKRILGGDFLPIRQVTGALRLKAKITFRPPLAALIKYFFGHEKMRAAISPWVKRIPWLYQRLLRVGINIGVIPPPVQNAVPLPHLYQRQEATFPEELPNLTPRARRIYLDLEAIIDHRNKENG